MPHSFGYRARTRALFARKFREHGVTHLSDYMHVYKVGDYVDVVANASIHKGMPFKFYHGRTGRVWNVTPRAVGVEIKKQVGNRYIMKRIHVRVEHVRKSRCTEDFEKRKKEYIVKCTEAKKNGAPKPSKVRKPAGPRDGEIVTPTATTQIINLAPREYEFLI